MTSREQFEAWAEKEHYCLAYGDCGYVYSSTAAAWKSWQAASKASEQQLAAVVAENEVLKDDYRTTPALKRMGWPKTPATDAYLAEIRAQGVEMYADTLDRGADDAERGGFDDGMKFLRAEAEGVRKFAAQLRQGVAK